MADPLHTGSVRVGAADRTLVAERLVAHYQAGRLPRPELELRLTQVAHALTDDDLHRLTIDLPDVPGPVRPVASAPRPSTAKPSTSPLRVAFDVLIMVFTFAAAVCLILLLILAGTSSTSSAPLLLVASLSAFGAFTIGAGTVHLLHRTFGRK